MVDPLLILLILLGVVTSWFLFCNNKTYLHRDKIIEEARQHVGNEEFWKKIGRLNKITYEQHLFRLVTGRWSWRKWYEN